MSKVNLRKAASYAALENTGKVDVSVAQASEIIKDFIDYLIENHKGSEICELFERQQ